MSTSEYPAGTDGGNRPCRGSPVLSVLLPTYNQPGGVERILRRLEVLKGDPQVEIIVSDDSSDEMAARRILEACETFGDIRHMRNRPGLGALPNWNRLLRCARGEYCWLLHHDEEPSQSLDLPKLLQALADPSAADAWLLACHVVHSNGARPRLHFPVPWAVAIVRRWPAYLLRRNLIGPPSSLIVRRRSYVSYDERLRWRVDVEAYFRMLQPQVRLRAWPSGGVTSYKDQTNSITAHLAPDLRAVEAQERALLLAAHGDRSEAGIWLKSGVLVSMGRSLESIAWTAFRGAYRGAQWLRAVWN